MHALFFDKAAEPGERGGRRGTLVFMPGVCGTEKGRHQVGTEKRMSGHEDYV